MASSKISRKGLTTVPKEIRTALGVEEGDRLSWRLRRAEGHEFIEVEALKHPLKFLKGRRKDKRLTYLEAEEAADRLILREASK